MDQVAIDKSCILKIIRKEKNARMRLRLLAILHFQEGRSRYQIAAFLKVSRTSVNKWVNGYLSNGLSGLKEKAHSGRPSALSIEQKVQLNNYIESRKNILNTDKLKGNDVQSYIESNFGIKYEISSIYKIIEKL
ncbi:helix-turn-helix domain-containing protein [Shewanella sp. KX20019]|uniref:helix-turn-helix domain-containing protein n=1 Tax=Shewanella sp. KX20019 TaxID=2803864 RepID=UPI00192623DE|nr:helix-turn-helix domain-containing protein [Shewanella sp. KX20019]QQX82300.1 helix-turn-helix domain-containing protein [Shewanella sp. KX20019]